MKKLVYPFLLGLVLAGLLIPGVRAQDGPAAGQVDTDNAKRAQTGMKFVAMSVSARAAGLGNAMTAIQSGSIAMFYNPATMAHTQDFVNVAVGQTQFVADINYNIASVSFRPSEGRFGIFGVNFMNVDYGTFYGTVPGGEGGFTETGQFSPTALVIGLGYARALTDRFAVGANLKYARQDLTGSIMGFDDGGGAGNEGSYQVQDNAETAVAVDFGVLYNTGFRSLNFAMSARNFSREVTYQQENFELPLMLTIGISMDMMDLASQASDMHSLVVSVDAQRPRDFYESVSVGGEYSFMDILYLRAGYAFPTDEQGLSLGLGLNAGFSGIGLGADYAYTNFGILGNVNRISLQFSM